MDSGIFHRGDLIAQQPETKGRRALCTIQFSSQQCAIFEKGVDRLYDQICS